MDIMTMYLCNRQSLPQHAMHKVVIPIMVAQHGQSAFFGMQNQLKSFFVSVRRRFARCSRQKVWTHNLDSLVTDVTVGQVRARM
jgi:hypothetical protein